MAVPNWDSMAARDRDRWVAANVFQGVATWHPQPYKMTLCPYVKGPFIEKEGTWSHFCTICGEPAGYHNGFPAFTTDIGADYLVLCEVRTKWGGNSVSEFCMWLHQNWHGRSSTYVESAYQPGDYSLAAAHVLGNRQ